MNKYQEAYRRLYEDDYSSYQGIAKKRQNDWNLMKNLVDKATPKKPKVKHYENEGEEPYIKYICPNDCGIQLSPVTEKGHAHESRFCRKCG